MSIARKYELVYITPPETTDEALAELHTQIAEIVTAGGGTIDSTENWGRRRLAYEVERFREGIYVLENLSGPADLTRELERRLRVMDIVLRHLVIRVDEDVAVAERASAKRKAWTSARRVRRGLPPERAEGEGQRDPGSEPTATEPTATEAPPPAETTTGGVE
jgi:small subunit ribosomal protein S6